MKLSKWTNIGATISLAVLATALFAVGAASAAAQQTTLQRGNSPLDPGYSLMPGPNQKLQQRSKPNLETTNQNIRYNVVPIGVLPGRTDSFLALRAVNHLGHVTGYSWNNNDDRFLTSQGFVWRNGHIQALPLLPGWPSAFAYSINDLDQVAGIATKVDADGNDVITAVVWDHGQPMALAALQPHSISLTYDVNILGVAVGDSFSFDTNLDLPVVWYGGKAHQLPLLPGYTQGEASEINAFGMIDGYQVSDTDLVPCLWYWNGTGYTAVNLGTFGGTYGFATGINNLGQAVGSSHYPGNETSAAFLWDLVHGLQALPLLPGDNGGVSNGINDLGQAVGFSIFSSPDEFSIRAVIWQNGTVTDLQTLVPPGTLPFDINISTPNDLGDIPVTASNPDGSFAALLLVPKH